MISWATNKSKTSGSKPNTYIFQCIHINYTGHASLYKTDSVSKNAPSAIKKGEDVKHMAKRYSILLLLVVLVMT